MTTNFKTYVCDFPFRKDNPSVEFELYFVWYAGCRIKNVPAYYDYGPQYFECDALGKKFMKLMRTVEFPGRTHNRVIYQTWYEKPNGEKTKVQTKLCTNAAWKRLLNGFDRRLPILVMGASFNGQKWQPTPFVEIEDCEINK